MRIPPEAYSNPHWWLRFRSVYSVDPAHDQINPGKPILIVPTSLEEGSGLRYRCDAGIWKNEKEFEKLRRIWKLAFSS